MTKPKDSVEVEEILTKNLTTGVRMDKASGTPTTVIVRGIDKTVAALTAYTNRKVIEELEWVIDNIYWPIEGDRQTVLERIKELKESSR